MNSVIIKTMQLIVHLYFWIALFFGVSGGIALAKYLEENSGVSISLGMSKYIISAPGSYVLFGFVGLIVMLLFIAPVLAGWTILYSNNQLLKKIERNTSAQVEATISGAEYLGDNSKERGNFFVAD